MFKKKNLKIDKLYNKIFLLSRNKFLYKNLDVPDTLNSRINLIFIHVSFLLIALKKAKENEFSQMLFDYMFHQIDANLRELGHGDMSVNKQMKMLIRIFYKILIDMEKFNVLSDDEKIKIFTNLFYMKNDFKNDYISTLINYFKKFRIFTINLPINNIKKGDINFSYRR